MYKPYVGVFVIYIRCYLSLFLYFFCGSFAFASLKVSVDFKPWFESFQTILSEEKGTNEVVDLIESCGELSRKSDTSKMIREYFVANNLSSTDTLEEFLEKKECQAPLGPEQSLLRQRVKRSIGACGTGKKVNDQKLVKILINTRIDN